MKLMEFENCVLNPKTITGIFLDVKVLIIATIASGDNCFTRYYDTEEDAQAAYVRACNMWEESL